MRKENNYDQEYCIRLIRLALSSGRKKSRINTLSVKKSILSKVKNLQEIYGLDINDLFSEISRHFVEKEIILKIDSEKAGPTTFILYYVLNQLRNIEKSCWRGTFEKAHKNCDAMDLVVFHLEEVAEDRTWFKELIDYNDPESLLVAKESGVKLLEGLEVYDRALILQEISILEYCKLNDVSISTCYRRMADLKLALLRLTIDL